MKPYFMLLLTFLLCWQVSMGQQPTYTGIGHVTFSAGAPLDLIKGTSTEVTGSIDPVTGKVYFEIPVKSFQFANSLMQERFNDKYMQTDRHPKAIFTGQVANFSESSKEVTASGTLTIHGVSKRRSIKGKITRKGSQLILESLFVVSTKEHHIDSPKLTSGFMAENINVNLRLQLTPDQKPAQVVVLNQKRGIK
ncbi:YceI family protein [uncultured Pontibacter sp.]|uniref:YceI family protein n=1 Tax=uncultured Pontibacter sp. TaxID=453356 RepID=UPI002625B084|nr:YceI family protein [uncultured Pontibacter sp.]